MHIKYRINVNPGSFWYTGTYSDFLKHIDELKKKINKDIVCTEIYIHNIKNEPNGWIHILPDGLKSIIIEKCNVGILPKLPDTIERIEIYTCDIKVLPKLPSKLKCLICSDTNIIKYPILPFGLEDFFYNNSDKLTEIPIIPPTIINYWNSSRISIANIIKMGYTKCSNKIGLWFLNCKYNPEYKYCRDRLEAEYNNMYEMNKNVN